MTEQLELADVQGLVVRGYGGLPFASFLLLQIVDVPSAGAVLSRWAERVSTAESAPGRRVQNVAGFTFRERFVVT